MSGTPLLSVVVVTYRREEVMVDTLRHLLRQEYPAWELIVVDQTPAHAPETEAFLAAHGGALKLIRLGRPGMAQARNVGIDAARGEIVLFCDDDIIPAPGLLAAHARNYVGATVGGVTGPTTLSPGRPQMRARTLYATGRIVSHRDATTPGETDALFGCNMSWRRDALLRVGGFDEGYIMRAHHEETDVSLRVRSLGYRLLYDPVAAVEHLVAPGGTRDGEASAAYAYGWHHNNAYFYSKHFAPRALPGFLRIHLGHLVGRMLLQARQYHLLLPSLKGLSDGYRAGARARAARHG